MGVILPTGALLGNLQTGTLDQALDLSGHIFALQVYTQWLPDKSMKKGEKKEEESSEINAQQHHNNLQL